MRIVETEKMKIVKIRQLDLNSWPVKEIMRVLGVTRQTVSLWRTGQTIPAIEHQEKLKEMGL